MPEARLQRTREAYDDRPRPKGLAAIIAMVAPEMFGTCTNEMRTVTDTNGNTLHVRIPRRFEVRR